MIISRTILETANGTFAVAMHEGPGSDRCLTLSAGNLDQPGVAIRMHSSCVFGEAFRAHDCDCGPQLHTALREITHRGAGAVVYLFQEGRGAGLDRKIQGMERQRIEGINSYAAYAALGLPRDMRDYSAAGVALADLGVQKDLTLMSNNPAKRAALEEMGYRVVEQFALSYQVNERAYDYLLMKQTQGDHVLDLRKIVFVP